MNRQLIIIISVLLILGLGLIFGFPFEFFNATVDRIVTISIGVLVLIIFIQLFRLTLRVNKKPIKWVAVSLMILIAIPYFLIGIYTTLFITTNYYPMWEDIAIYTKPNGEKIISKIVLPIKCSQFTFELLFGFTNQSLTPIFFRSEK